MLRCFSNSIAVFVVKNLGVGYTVVFLAKNLLIKGD